MKLELKKTELFRDVTPCRPVNSLVTDVSSVRAFGTLLFFSRHGTNSRGLESSATPPQGSLVYVEQSVVIQWIAFREGNRLPRRAHIKPADVIGDNCPCEGKHHWWCHFAMEGTGYQAVFLMNCLSYQLTVFCLQGTMQYTTCLHCSVKCILNWREIPTWCNNLFIITNNSTCFGHLYAPLQEY